MIIDIKKFKKNILFFIVSIGLLVFIVLISSIFGTSVAKLKEEELKISDVPQGIPAMDFKSVLEKAKNFKNKK